MKIILEYNNFIKKYKAINEGGGAGKDIKFKDFSFDIALNYSKGILSLVKKNVELGDTIDIVGYQDGLRDIKTEELFETSISYVINEENLANLTVKNIRYYTHELFDGIDETKTLKELSEESDIDIVITGGGTIEHMYGGGWITPKFEKDSVLTLNMNELNDGYDSWINNANIYDCLDKYCEISITANLKALEKFDGLWKELFFDYETYEDYLKSLGTDNIDTLSEEDFYNQKQEDLRIKYCE